MSHAYGEVVIDSKVVRWFEYNGTSDIAMPHLYTSHEALSEDWRKGPWTQCTCGKPPTDCFLWSSYGYGFYWPSKVCLDCDTITGEKEPYELDGDWPKRGKPPLAT